MYFHTAKYKTHYYQNLLVCIVCFFAASNLARKHSEYFSENVLCRKRERPLPCHPSLVDAWPLYIQENSKARESFLEDPGQRHCCFQLLYFTCEQLQTLLFHFHAVA